jgi:flagellar hook-length control protein FliK
MPTPGIAPHSAKDSVSQPGTTPNPAQTAPVLTPVTVMSSSAPGSPTAAAAVSDYSAELFALTEIASGANATSGADIAGATGVPVTDAAGDPALAGIGGKSDSQGGKGIAIEDAADDAMDDTIDQTVGAPGSPASADAQSSTQPDAAKSTAHPQPEPQTLTPETSAALAQAAKDAGARNLQLLANSAGAMPQAAAHNQLPLPNAATLVSPSGGTASSDSTKSVADNRESIATRIQPGLSSLNATLSPTSASQAALAASGTEGTGSDSSGSASGQSSGHAPGQSSAQSSAQSSSQAHSSDDGKSSTTVDSSQPAAQSDLSISNAQQNASIAAASANSAAITIATAGQSAHATAQAAAQADASASASASMKSTVDSSPAAGQSASLAASLPNTLPRSLNDISQATQLYQRVGGAEMHIAMDTDLLGSIDLRAIVHQGSLSATIGVQRADVQTLLVNELPALQHSLAEKNLQVGQISVLADSIGSGTNANSQPQDQQNRQGTSAPTAPVFRDDPSPAFTTRVPMNAIAAFSGNSARLSVLA